MSYLNIIIRKNFLSIFFLMLIIALLPCNARAGVVVTPHTIGVAKTSSHIGRSVTLSFFIENFSANTLTQINLSDDLDTVFGAGNYSVGTISNASGPSTLTLNTGFDGSTDTQLITGGSLQPGQTVQINVNVNINAFVDLGSGLGIYSNQVTVSAFDNGVLVSDLSDFGTNPDPSGNNDPSDMGEDDPTPIDLTEQPALGVAKSALLSGNTVTLDFRIKNLGNRTLQSISLIDDLDAAFGAGNYSITSGPTFIDDPGTITLNTGFDGSASNDLISTGSLAIQDEAHIQIQVSINNVVDLGMGLGVYQNQAQVSGQTATGTLFTDISDDGTNPDSNGNNNPNEASENDPTIIVLGEAPVIGVAKDINVTGNTITVDVYLENLGNTTLSNLSVTDNLNTVFGAGNFFVSSAPAFIDDPGTLNLNASFNGNAGLDLISSGTLAAGDTAQIRFVAQLLTLSDQGLGLGNYENQILATATAPGGGFTQDLSDDGTDPDPNGNNNPGESGEDDVTGFSVAEQSSIGIAKRFISLGNQGAIHTLELQFTVTNYGNRTISNLSITEDLNAVYGAGNFIHTVDPVFVSGINSLNYNSAFNGSTNTALLTGGSLEPGESVTFKINHLVVNLTDQGFGVGIYQNQVTAIGTDPNASPVSDLSHAGSNPDENGNGDPGDDNAVTVIDLNQTGAIGIANDATVSGNVVTFDLFIENLGTLELSQISINHMLATLFGDGNFTISSAPSLIDDPGTIVLNPDYNGFTENELLNISSSTLAAGDTASIQLQVSISPITNHQGLGIGVYSSQSTINAVTSLSGAVNDTSNFGTDPDPNGNGNANEAGENDATPISIGLDTPIGIAKDVSVAGSVVTVDLYLENFGASTLSAVDLIDDLDAAFGASNYQITSPPTFIDDPGTLVLNGGFNGSTDNSILGSGSTLVGGDTAQIRFVVNVITESDQGNGFGIYQNQARVNASQPNGLNISDLSDDGTDPDPNGNGDPSEPGEEDPSTIVISVNPAIAIAKKATVNGTSVTLDFYIENIGNSTLTNVILEDQLNPVFGSGNYNVSSQPSLVSGSGTLVRSGNFFGFSVFDVVVGGGFLRPGETEVVRVVVSVNTVSDVGNGLGEYLNSVTVLANAPDGTPVSDVSDDGIVPNPNGTGAAGEAGENDPTRIIIGDEANIGIATTASVSGQQVTFDIYLENLGTSILDNFSLIDNLDSLFGPGNYTINSAPTFIDDPGSLTLNGGYDGSADPQLFSGGTLAGSDTAQIRLVVDVSNPVDQGLGLGNYSQQLSVTARAPMGTIGTDFSDNGTNPDPNGNNNPQDTNESDPTLFTVQAASIGIAKQATLDQSDPTNTSIIFEFVVTNLGTATLTDVTVTDDLDAVFGTGNYTITSEPSFTSGGRDLSPNPSFNGGSDKNVIIPGATLSASASVNIRLTVRIDTVVDNGSGLGVYENQALASGVFNMNPLSDLSDAGVLPDPNADGVADGAGEDDPTQFSLFPVAPAFTMAFNPDVIKLSGTTKLIYTIDNSQGLFTAGSLAFNNNLPAGLTIAAVPNLVNSCGGTVTAPALGSLVSLVNGAVNFKMNCSISVDVVPSLAGMLVNTSGDLTSTSGNSGSASDTLDVDAPPTMTAPANITQEATANLTPVALGTPTVTDDRDVGLIATADNTGPYPVGMTTVTWSVTDSGGSTTTAMQTVTITDSNAPVVIPPAAINQEASGATTAVAIGAATATDIVDGVVVATPSSTGPFPLGVTTVIWSATDTAGNTGTANQTVTIVDTTAPVVNAPVNITQEATGTTTAVAIGTATVTDLVNTGLVATPSTTGPFPVGSTIVTWTATDLSGNNGSANQTITIEDTTAPVISLLGANPLTLNTGDTFTDPGATAMDLVDGNLDGAVSSSGIVNTAVPATYIINYSVIDTAGNTATASRSVIVNDGNPPVVIPPANINQEATGPTSTINLGTATVTDDVDVGLIATPSTTGPFPVGITTVTWVATDNAGNVGSAAQTVTIVDTTLPVVTPPADISQEATGATTAVNLGVASVSDVVSTGLIATANNPGPYPVGTTIVTWTATDGAGNVGIGTQNVTITDTTPPVVTVIGANPVMLTTGAVYSDQGATATDLVDGDLTASISVTNPVNTAIAGTYQVSYEVTDTAGNTATAIRTVMVNVSVLRSFIGTLPSGQTGRLTFTTSDPGCRFANNPQFIDVSAATTQPPVGLNFVDGLISFQIDNCAVGATVNITMDYGQPVPAGAGYWKQGSPWFPLTSTVIGNTINFSITDGGLGDASGADGSITDPGGAAVDNSVITPTKPIPTLSEWVLILLSMLMLSVAVLNRSHRI